MRKKLLMFSIIFIIIGSIVVSHAQNNELKKTIFDYPLVKISVDDYCMECGEGFNVNGTTYVPLRFVLETLGVSVNWNSSNHSIVVSNNNNQRETNHDDVDDEVLSNRLVELYQQMDNEVFYYLTLNEQISLAVELYNEFNDTTWFVQIKQGSLVKRKNALRNLNDDMTDYFQNHSYTAEEAGQLNVLYKKMDDIVRYYELALTSYEKYMKTNETTEYKNHLLYKKFTLDMVEELQEKLNEQLI